MTNDTLKPPSPNPSAIEQAAALIAQADAGFWKAYPALANDGVGFMDIASPSAFHADPRRAWGFYGHRLALYRKTVPHAGFALLRKWGEAMARGYFVFTSNVDGQFQKAGFDSLRIDECHGSIHHLQCMGPCSHSTWDAGTFDPVVDAEHCALVGPMPACPRCGGIARPNILMFDDWHWIDTRRAAQAAHRQGWLEQARRPVVIEIGAGLNVATVRHFSHRIVLQHNGALIRINPREAQVGSLQGVGIDAGALQALTAIDALLGQRRGIWTGPTR